MHPYVYKDYSIFCMLWGGFFLCYLTSVAFVQQLEHRIGGALRGLSLTRGFVMKKVLFSVIALAALAGCAYDYYRGGVRYVQDGEDCVFYYGEYGSHYTNDIRNVDTDKRVVYRNTSCAELFARDNGGIAPRPQRAVLTRAAAAAPASCGCDKCAAKSAPRYVIVPAM